MSQVCTRIDRRGAVGKGILGGRKVPVGDAKSQVKEAASRSESFPRERQEGQGLRAEDVPLDMIARAIGTPCYVYSSAAIREQYRVLSEAMGKLDARLHYSVKANSSIAILALLRELGAGLDI